LNAGKSGEIVAPDSGRAAMGEHFEHPLFGKLLRDERIRAAVIGDHADVEAVALVAGATVGDVMQCDRHQDVSRIAHRAISAAL
jgi:hypothetical protein